MKRFSFYNFTAIFFIISVIKVVDKIRSSGDVVTFLVVDSEADKHFKAKGLVISITLLTKGIRQILPILGYLILTQLFII